MVLWKFRCPLQWSRKTKVDVNNVLDKYHKAELGKPWYFRLQLIINNETLTAIHESGPDGTREYNHTYENKWCKITTKFDIQGNAQPTSLPDLVKSAEFTSRTIESTRDRLGASVGYLEGVLALGDLVKDVSSFIPTS